MNQSLSKDDGLLGKYLYACLSVVLGVWVIYRAFFLSITNDEAYTFYNVATRNIKMMCGTANTHWLNSIFVFLETALLGNREWMIRIHSMLGFFMFSFAIYQFCKNFITKHWQWLIPIGLLLLNIYILDFFSLARGYGLSMAFEIMAFYYISQSDECKSNRFYSYFFLSLATFSCYTCIFILFAFFIHEVFSKIKIGDLSRIFSKTFLLPVLPLIFTFLWAIPNILFIRHEGDLEEGQSNGFLHDTSGVFFERSFPILQDLAKSYIWLGVLFVLLIGFYYQYRKVLDRKVLILFEILFINILIIEVLFIFFDIPFIFGRTSLSFNVLFILLIVYAIVYILQKVSPIPSILSCMMIFTACTYNYIFCKNHRVTIEWYKTQGIEKCIGEIEALSKKAVDGKKLGLHLSQLGSYTNYYQYLNNYPLNDTVYSFCENTDGFYDANTISKMLKQDYLIILKPYEQYLNENQYIVLKNYGDMGADLIEIRK